MRAALRAVVLAAALASEASEAPLPSEPTSPPGACYVHLQECDGHPTGEWFAVDPVSGQPARQLSEANAAFVYVEKDGNKVCGDYHGLQSPADADACSEAATERGVDFGTFPHGPRCHLYNGKVYYNPNGDLPLGNSPPLCQARVLQPTAASAPSVGLRFVADPGFFVQQYTHSLGTVRTACGQYDTNNPTAVLPEAIQNQYECRQAAWERRLTFMSSTIQNTNNAPKCYKFVDGQGGASIYFNEGTPVYRSSIYGSWSTTSRYPLCRRKAHTIGSTNTLCSTYGLVNPQSEAECEELAYDQGVTLADTGTWNGYPPCHKWSDNQFYWTTGTEASDSIAAPVCRLAPKRSCVAHMYSAGETCDDESQFSPNSATECFQAAQQLGYTTTALYHNTARPRCYRSGSTIYYNHLGDVGASSRPPICCLQQYYSGADGATCADFGGKEAAATEEECRAAANDVNGLSFQTISNPNEAGTCYRDSNGDVYWNSNPKTTGAPSSGTFPICHNIPESPIASGSCGCYVYAPVCYNTFSGALYAPLDGAWEHQTFSTTSSACEDTAEFVVDTVCKVSSGGATLADAGMAASVVRRFAECLPPSASPSPPPPSASPSPPAPNRDGTLYGECPDYIDAQLAADGRTIEIFLSDPDVEPHRGCKQRNLDSTYPVSYTHLTLPTILLV